MNPIRPLACIALFGMAAAPISAAPIYGDSFNYGDTTVAIGGLGGWNSGSAVLKYDHDGGLDHPAMSGETGGAMWLDFTDARTASDSSLNFDLTTLSEGDEVWIAALFQYVTGNTSHELTVTGGSVSSMGVKITAAGNVQVVATLNTTVNATHNTGLSLTDGTHLMLLRHTKGSGTSPIDSSVDLWINPADTSSPGALGTADWTLDSADGQVKWGRDGNVLSGISATPSQQGRIDEIRLATTLADVITPAADATAPSIVAPTNPADDASGVLVTATLSATFDENIVLVDGGTITIDDLGGGTDTLITLPDGRVSVTDQTLTITPDAPLAINTNYAVQISNDAIRDFAPTPNFFAGISDTTTWNFQTAADGTPPSLATTTPADNAIDVAIDANLVATFDEAVVAGSGNITLDNLSGGADLVISVTDAQVTVSGSTLTISPTAALAPGANYAVRIAAGALTDTTGNAFPGILDNTTWNFTTAADTTNPALVSLSPADEGFIGASGSLVATFDEPIAIGSGNITVKNLTKDTQTVYAVTDLAVTVSGSQLTITPGSPLVVGDQYAVQIEAGAVTDVFANPFAGILNDTTWNFTIAATLNLTVVADTYLRTANGPQDGDPDDELLVGSFSGGSAARALLRFDTSSLAALGTIDIVGVTLVGTNRGASGAGGSLDIDVHDYGFEFVEVAADWDDPDGDGDNGTGDTAAGGTPGTLVATVTGHSVSSNAVANFAAEPAFVTLIENALAGDNAVNLLVKQSTEVSANQYTRFSDEDQPNPFKLVVNYTSSGGPGGNTFADWIGGFTGLGGLTALNDDADGDGIDNGVENFFGTAPNAFNQGLLVSAADPGAGTFTFTHPQNATPATDLTAVYQWSTDLATFHGDGVASGGTTVSFSASPNTPVAGTTTVTATVSGTPVDKLFVTVEVTSN